MHSKHVQTLCVFYWLTKEEWWTRTYAQCSLTACESEQEQKKKCLKLITTNGNFLSNWFWCSRRKHKTKTNRCALSSSSTTIATKAAAKKKAIANSGDDKQNKNLRVIGVTPMALNESRNFITNGTKGFADEWVQNEIIGENKWTTNDKRKVFSNWSPIF